MFIGSGSWGDGSWGTSYWGTERYNIISDNQNIKEAEAVWDSGIEFASGSNTHRLMRALLSQADRMDDDLEEIYEQHHINSATREELDAFGKLVNVKRKSGEPDDKYRSRIKATFRASTIGTTFDQFTEFCATVIDTDIDNLNFTTPYDNNPATVVVGADSDVYDNATLTPTEVQTLLESGVPAGHAVSIVEGGTFRLKSDGDTDDPDKGLTSDSISSGGTLSEDLVN